MASQAVQAVGFGRVATRTQLGQPLDFSAAVRVEADESLTRDCVFAEVTAGENRISPGLVRVTLEGNPGDADRTVRVTTTTPIDEPVVAVSVMIGCTAKVTRRFVAFIDPPGLNLAQATPTDTAPLPAARAESETAAPARPGGLSRPAPVRPAAPPAARAAAARAADAASRASAPATPTAEASEHRSSAPRRAAGGPRLQLEAPTLALGPRPAASAPVVIDAAAAPVAASAPVRDEQAELLAAQRQRIAALEDEVRRLQAEALQRQQADALARQQALLTVQTSAPVRRSDRYANPLTYSLALLSFLATILVCGFLGRRARDRASARWAAGMALVAPEPPASASPAEPVDSEADVVEPSGLRADASPVEAEQPLHRTSPRAAMRAPPPVDTPIPVVVDSLAHRADRASSVEELIDLEQQVDFFIVLGQDDAAIELLTNHAANDPGGIPLPLLKLLEIHRRLGDREAHDRVLANVSRDFNVDAPGWDADPAQGRSLEAYPDVMARLQTLWPAAAKAVACLDDAVFRRGASMPAFDLPAYRELLLLHAVARDHAADEAHAVVSDDVDLLLPLEASSAETPIARLTASRDDGPPDFVPSELVTAPLDLDVSFGAPTPAPSRPVRPASVPRADNAETVPAALRRPADYGNESSFVDVEIDLPDAALAPSRRG